MYMHVCLYMYVYIFKHVYVCMYMYACICMHVYVCICMYVYVCVYMYVCMYVCLYMCVYAYMYVYVCIIYWGIVRGKCPTQNGRGNCPGRGIVQGGIVQGELSYTLCCGLERNDMTIIRYSDRQLC